MIGTKVEQFTLAELLDHYIDKASRAYSNFREAKSEETKTTFWEEWSHSDDCVFAIKRLLSDVREDLP